VNLVIEELTSIDTPLLHAHLALMALIIFPKTEKVTTVGPS